MDLWAFSCAFYADHRVQKDLLLLQDQCGVNVNHILLGVWSWGMQHQAISVPLLLRRERETEFITSVMQPVRQFRRQAKAVYSQSVYDGMKAIELQCEKHHLDWLAQLQPEISVPDDTLISAHSTLSTADFIVYCQRYLKALCEAANDSLLPEDLRRCSLTDDNLSDWFDALSAVVSPD